MIRRVFDMIASLKDVIRIVYVPNYEMRWAQLLTSGVDLWLNTPQRLYEASGSSGMKAALNGVPSLSVPDGWWREGYTCRKDGIPLPQARKCDSADVLLRRKMPTLKVMRLTIALNGSFFNAQRMLAQYVMNAYFSGKQGSSSAQQAIEDVRRSQPVP